MRSLHCPTIVPILWFLVALLYDNCQPEFSFLHSSELPLELCIVANKKKARNNKTPMFRPSKFLEVAHYGIGFGG
jgi:hypothetical protein